MIVLPLLDAQRRRSKTIPRQRAERPEELGTAARHQHGQGADDAAALAELKKEGKCPEGTVHRQVKYLNNGLEADHGKLKQLICPVRGFKTLKTAYATTKGFEVMRALRKGQARAFNITHDIRGEARLVERAFGLRASPLAEAIQFISERLEVEQPDQTPRMSTVLRASTPAICNRAPTRLAPLIQRIAGICWRM